jgi:DNA gyrase subunit A
MAIDRISERDVNIEDEMRTSYLSYAMSVIVQRALPDVRDGLKPVHRRVLFGMDELNLQHNSAFKKSARIVGDVMGKYHPHGDVAIYDTLVRMAQDFSMRYPLVDGQGNFGSVDGDPPAAMRYTEARLTELAEEMLADIDRDTVDFYPNFDGSAQQPTVLPSRIPNLLMNGSTGIAVGMATNIPPHNLGEVCDAIVMLIDQPEATIEDLMKVIKGPDFPTGGIILGREGIQSTYTTGRGRILMRAVAQTEEAKNGRQQLIVTELPYQVNKAVLIEKIAELIKEKRIEGISELRDESDRHGMRIVMELKRDAQPNKLLNALYKHTAMQTSFNANVLALVDIEPRTLTLKRMLQEFITHRQVVVTRRTQFDLRKARERAHILEGLKIALDNLDAVIACIRRSQTGDTAVRNLMTEFKLTEIQARAIGDLALRRLASLERKRILDEDAEVLKQIRELEAILSDVRRVLAIVKEETNMLKTKFGDPRRTRIALDESGDLSLEDIIPHELMLVTLTGKGYVKRTPQDTYRKQRRGGKGRTGMITREEDSVQHSFAADTLTSVLFFTDRGRVFTLRVHELPESAPQGKGLPLSNLLAMDPKESVSTLAVIDDFADGKYLTMATRQGVVKKTSLLDYSSVRRNGLIAISLNEGDELTWVKVTDGKQDVILVTEHGQSIRFNEREIRATSRDTEGVRGIRLRAGDRVVGMDVMEPGANLLIVTTNGYGKRTQVAEYPVQARGGIGVTTVKLTEKTGLLVAGRVVREGDTDLVLVASDGLVIRQPLESVRVIGRSTQGVSLMNLRPGATVVSLSVIGEGPEGENLN